MYTTESLMVELLRWVEHNEKLPSKTFTCASFNERNIYFYYCAFNLLSAIFSYDQTFEIGAVDKVGMAIDVYVQYA